MSRVVVLCVTLALLMAAAGVALAQWSMPGGTGYVGPVTVVGFTPRQALTPLGNMLNATAVREAISPKGGLVNED